MNETNRPKNAQVVRKRPRPGAAGLKWWRMQGLKEAIGNLELSRRFGFKTGTVQKKFRWDRDHSLRQKKGRRVAADRKKRKITRAIQRRRAAKGQNRRDGS